MGSSNSYQIINDARYDFLLGRDCGVAMRDTIENVAREKTIIFVEGYDDKAIFEIIFLQHSQRLFFLDVSMEQPKRTSHPNVVAIGGCEQVKSLLIDFVRFRPQDKRFYGVIDRDLKTDQEIEAERDEACYNGRLFIFQERYTLENYFVRPDVLKTFIHGQSVQHKKLIPLVNDDTKLNEIIDDIISCLAKIAAANLTIRFFDNSVEFVEGSIDCGDDEGDDEIEKRVHHRLKGKCEGYVEAFVNAKFQLMKDFIMQSYPENVQKFASAKTYFASQFNRRLKADYKVDLQINNHKQDLARILNVLPPLAADFNVLLELILREDFCYRSSE